MLDITGNKDTKVKSKIVFGFKEPAPDEKINSIM